MRFFSNLFLLKPPARFSLETKRFASMQDSSSDLPENFIKIFFPQYFLERSAEKNRFFVVSSRGISGFRVFVEL